MRNLIVIALCLVAGSAAAEVDAKTGRTWKAKCAACHGEDGKGQTDAGKKLGVADMAQAAWQKKTTDEAIKTSVAKGIKTKHGAQDVEMPAFADLKPEQVDGLIKLIRGLAK